MSFWVKIKKKLSEFLVRMARENEKSFGSGKLDCCQLNRKPNNKN